MEYTELLNKIQTELNIHTSFGNSNNKKPIEMNINNILNKIELEVQRQGGN